MDRNWRELFTDQTARATNADTGEIVHVRTFVRDPANVEGLQVRFHYRTSDRRILEYHLLCWRCWTSSETIFLSGMCGKCGYLHQFVIENIFDLVELSTDTAISNPANYFLPLADISDGDIQLKRLFKNQRTKMKENCLLGLKILTYISHRNKLSLDREIEIIEHYLQARLGQHGPAGAKLINDLLKSLRRVVPTAAKATKALKAISADEAHLDAVWSYSEILLSNSAAIPASKLERVKELIES